MAHPSSSAPAAAAETTSLAPGFRFHPTDEELVSYYLKRKVLGRPLKVDAIAEVDLYKLEPWDLPARSRLLSRDSQWYFFSRLDRKHANRARTNRATAGGYWKTTGKDREVCHGARVVGMKKTLVFHAGRAPKGERTNWVMHEYRLEGDDAAGIPQDSFVVCRIFQKAGPGPQNGAQYGAPFVEEEWEDDDVGLLPVETDIVADREVPGAMEKGYLQMNDLTQGCWISFSTGFYLFCNSLLTNFYAMLSSRNADMHWLFDIFVFLSGLGSKSYEITTHKSHDVIVFMSMIIERTWVFKMGMVVSLCHFLTLQTIATILKM